MTEIAADDVLVVVGYSGIWGLHTEDGSLLWQHTNTTDGWPLEGVPLVAHMGDGVVAVAALKRIAWVRVTDGTVLGSDQLWFHIHRVIRHGPVLVVHGVGGGIACYRNGTRVWGVIGLPRDPTALVFTHHDAWTTDAHGQPIKPAGTLSPNDTAALVLGDSVAQIDRTTSG
jgi:hypothetical protein